MLDKYNHSCVICRQTGSLLQIMFPAVLNTRSLVLISFPPEQWTRHTYHIFLNVAYLNTLPAGLCIKPLEYILITILKRRTTYVVYVILSRYIVLEINFTLNTWRGLDVFQ